MQLNKMSPKLPPIVFERLVGRNVSRFISRKLDLAGWKTTVNAVAGAGIVGGLVITVLASVVSVVMLRIEFLIAFLMGVGLTAIYEAVIYSLLELSIDRRRDFVEGVLPDYLQLTAANMRSGVTLARAMALAVKPEFKYFGDDINIVGRQLYAGDTMANAFSQLSNKYRSAVLGRTVRVVLEANQYGGGMADLLNQIAKDLRAQQMVQKEVSGQLFMYTIFIAFAAIIGAPTLYGLTNQMIGVTTKVWSQISLGSLTSTPSLGASFIKLSKPLITPNAYFLFSLGAIIIITGFSAFIISAISTGNAFRGIKYMPVFIVAGLLIFFIVSIVMGSLFSSFGTV